MGKLTFYIVDVFAEEKFAGNQLAVFRGGAKLFCPNNAENSPRNAFFRNDFHYIRRETRRRL